MVPSYKKQCSSAKWILHSTARKLSHSITDFSTAINTLSSAAFAHSYTAQRVAAWATTSADVSSRCLCVVARRSRRDRLRKRAEITWSVTTNGNTDEKQHPAAGRRGKEISCCEWWKDALSTRPAAVLFCVWHLSQHMFNTRSAMSLPAVTVQT